MEKKLIRLTESDLHRIIKESVKQIIENAENEGLFGTRLFGNDEKYGEKWYNPNTWMSDEEKMEHDRMEKKLKANRAQRKEWDREREERNATERRNKEAAERRNKEVDKLRNLHEPDYRPRNSDGTLRVDFAGHVRPYRGEDAAYDAGLR